MSYKNHLSFGFARFTHKSKGVVSTIPSEDFESYYLNLNNVTFKVGYIPAGYQHRPDLISNLFYNTPTKDWLICMFNNIKDPFNELNVGDRILIPDSSYGL